MTLSSLSLSGGPATLTPVGGNQFSFVLSPLVFSAKLDVAGGGGALLVETVAPATLTLSGDEASLSITGIALGSFPLFRESPELLSALDQQFLSVDQDGAPPTDEIDLVIKLDFNLRAEREPATGVPEPTAALVFGLGFVTVGAISRRARSGFGTNKRSTKEQAE